MNYCSTNSWPNGQKLTFTEVHMHGIKAERTQVDGKQREYSDAARINTQVEPDLTRQEFKDAADTNSVLKRFGLGDINQRKPVFTETDFDLDLGRAFQTVADARYAYQKLPGHLKSKYRTWLDVLVAVEKGELTTMQPKAEDTVPITPPAA